MGRSNRVLKNRPKSKWTLKFHQVYPGLKFNKEAIARKTGIPREKLNTVYNRGLKAWRTGGSRPGASAHQWAIARVYKFVLVSNFMMMWLMQLPWNISTKVIPIKPKKISLNNGSRGRPRMLAWIAGSGVVII